MKSYLDIIQQVLDEGKWKENRTGTKAKTIANVHWEHYMSDRFPLLTTKKMAFKTICVELEGFIKGITSKKWYQERGCHIWDAWANPHKTKQKTITKWGEITNQDDLIPPSDEFIKQIQKEEDDLGPIYGRQWRDFGAAWDEYDIGVEKGTDQLKNIIDTLKTNPDDRRLVCSAWNPNQLSRMALPPCHLLWRIVHINGILNLHWDQRSCCMFLGEPFNIASYGLLLLLICKETNMKPGKLSCTLGDCHIYENCIKQIKLQLTRKPYKLPNIDILGNDFNIFNWTHRDIQLSNYESHPQIQAEVAI